MSTQKATQPGPNAPPLLRLPLELRQQIYTHLIPEINTSHPLPTVGITSVTHQPPTLSLLTIHPQITYELLDTFYALATWKLIFSHAFNFFRIDPHLQRLEACPSLRRLRKVEVVFYCDILLLKEYPSFRLQNFCAEIKRRADRACDVLLQAEGLRRVVVSWVDTTCTGSWREKALVLEPLKKLAGKVRYNMGEVSGPEGEEDRDEFVEGMREVLGISGVVEGGEGEVDDDRRPSNLRLLAFDVRQERHVVPPQQKEFRSVSETMPAAMNSDGRRPIAF